MMLYIALEDTRFEIIITTMIWSIDVHWNKMSLTHINKINIILLKKCWFYLFKRAWTSRNVKYCQYSEHFLLQYTNIFLIPRTDEPDKDKQHVWSHVKKKIQEIVQNNTTIK